MEGLVFVHGEIETKSNTVLMPTSHEDEERITGPFYVLQEMITTSNIPIPPPTCHEERSTDARVTSVLQNTHYLQKTLHSPAIFRVSLFLKKETLQTGVHGSIWILRCRGR